MATGRTMAAPRGRVSSAARSAAWTRRKQARFLAELAGTSNVAASARAAKISESTVYSWRARSDAFRDAWAEALREGYAKLELMLLERAMHGVDKPVFHGGAEVGRTREYSDRLAMGLLAAHREAAGRGETGVENKEDAWTEVELRFTAMRRRVADGED